MSTHSANIERLRIATQCPFGWEQMDLIIEPASEMETVGIKAGSPGLFDTTPGTTIIRGDLIRKLPIQK